MAAIVIKMEKDEFRAVIKHFYSKKWMAAIKAELNESAQPFTFLNKNV